MKHIAYIAGVLCVAASVLATCPLPVTAGDPLPAIKREEPAMQGHAAEAKLRDANEEAAHRRLFFDDAMAEAGTPGVSCAHRLARQPETSRGIGSVHVVWRETDGRVVARLWRPPETALSPDETTARLDLMVMAALGAPGLPGLKTETHSFAWCR
jgi:hypothetical protein